jgi:glycosyltransferase involved in cell wall biosynthesis
MAQIDILMATFRGEAFLTQQIHSLQDQTFRDWRLLIHDDGSDDATTQIIARFAAEDERIQWIEDGMTFHAPGPNFMHLLQFSTAPFAIFCDQDDIWLENKLEVMYRRILQQDNSLPQAVYSNSYVYDPVTDNLAGSLIDGSTLALILHPIITHGKQIRFKSGTQRRRVVS